MMRPVLLMTALAACSCQDSALSLLQKQATIVAGRSPKDPTTPDADVAARVERRAEREDVNEDEEDEEEDDADEEDAGASNDKAGWVCPLKCRKSNTQTSNNGQPSTANHNKDDDSQNQVNMAKCRKKACAKNCPGCKAANAAALLGTSPQDSSPPHAAAAARVERFAEHEDVDEDSEDEEDEEEDAVDEKEAGVYSEKSGWVCPLKCRKSHCQTSANGESSTANHNKADDCQNYVNMAKCKKKACAKNCPGCKAQNARA